MTSNPPIIERYAAALEIVERHVPDRDGRDSGLDDAACAAACWEAVASAGLIAPDDVAAPRRWFACLACGGSGDEDHPGWPDTLPCETCGGTGAIMDAWKRGEKIAMGRGVQSHPWTARCVLEFAATWPDALRAEALAREAIANAPDAILWRRGAPSGDRVWYPPARDVRDVYLNAWTANIDAMLELSACGYVVDAVTQSYVVMRAM